MPRPALVIAALGAFAAALALAAPAARACSLAIDWAEPPQVERDYDPALAPAKPQPIAATVHFYDDVGGCGGTSSCGDFEMLGVELAGLPEPARVRVLFPDGKVEYARPQQRHDGTVGFNLLWDGSALPATIMLETVTDEGYPSLPVTIGAVVDPDSAEPSGCAVSSRLPSPAALALGALALWSLRRRQRRYGSTR